MTALRWWIEKGDGSGYLMPVGADLTDITSVYEKSAGSPYWEGQNPPMILHLTGVATNQNSSATTAQVQTAIDDFNTFSTNKDSVAYVRMISYDGDADEAMGVSLGAIPGAASIVKTYDPAYTAAGFEVVDFNVSNITFPHNFTFEMRVSNLYIQGAGGGRTPTNVGDLANANIEQTRTVSNGIQSSETLVTFGLREPKQLPLAVRLLLDIATGSAPPLSEVFGDDGVTDPKANNVRIPNRLNAAEVDFINYSFNPVTLIFTGRIAASRPHGGRTKLFAESRGVNMVGSVDFDEGLIRARMKGPGSGRRGASPSLAWQRAYQPEASIELAITVTGFRLGGAPSDKVGSAGGKRFISQVDRLIAGMDLGPFVSTGSRYGRGTGGISARNIETGNQRTVRLNFFAAEDYLSDTGSVAPGSLGEFKDAALALLDSISLAVVLNVDEFLDNVIEGFDGSAAADG